MTMTWLENSLFYIVSRPIEKPKVQWPFFALLNGNTKQKTLDTEESGGLNWQQSRAHDPWRVLKIDFHCAL